MMFQNKLQSQKGISILLVIIVLAMISGIALGLTRIVITELQTQRAIENSVFTFFAAEAGIEKILYDDSQGIDIVDDCDDPGDCTGSLPNSATYEIIVEESGTGDCPPGGIYCATSTGSFGKGRRVISVEK